MKLFPKLVEKLPYNVHVTIYKRDYEYRAKVSGDYTFEYSSKSLTDLLDLLFDRVRGCYYFKYCVGGYVIDSAIQVPEGVVFRGEQRVGMGTYSTYLIAKSSITLVGGSGIVDMCIMSQTSGDVLILANSDESARTVVDVDVLGDGSGTGIHVPSTVTVSNAFIRARLSNLEYGTYLEGTVKNSDIILDIVNCKYGLSASANVSNNNIVARAVSGSSTVKNIAVSGNSNTIIVESPDIDVSGSGNVVLGQVESPTVSDGNSYYATKTSIADLIVQGAKNYRIYVDSSGYLHVYDLADSRDELVIQPSTLVKISEPVELSSYVQIDATKTVKVVGGDTILLENSTDSVNEISIDTVNNKTSIARPTYVPSIYGEKSWGYASSSVSLTVYASGTTPTESTVIDISSTDYKFLIPLVATLTVGGTVASTETVTVDVYAYDDAGNKYGPIMSYSIKGATGSEDVPVNLATLKLATGRRIVKVTAVATSSASSTSATASAEVYGIVL